MIVPKKTIITTEEFIRVWNTQRSREEVAAALGVGTQYVRQKLWYLRKQGIVLTREPGLLGGFDA
jgi:predicted ArsR family transcriptional regulator